MKHNPNIRHPHNQDDFLTRHHAYPLSRFKMTNPKGVNTHLVIKMWRKRHDAWHHLFQDRTIDEITHQLCFDKNVTNNPFYYKIFSCEPYMAVKILDRIKRIKNRK